MNGPPVAVFKKQFNHGTIKDEAFIKLGNFVGSVRIYFTTNELN
jgi:hypothetical protein